MLNPDWGLSVCVNESVGGTVLNPDCVELACSPCVHVQSRIPAGEFSWNYCMEHVCSVNLLYINHYITLYKIGHVLCIAFIKKGNV